MSVTTAILPFNLNADRNINFFEIAYTSGNEQQATNLLNNPKNLPGMNKETSPYILIFSDTVGTGPFLGGSALIVGYEYLYGDYGAQLSIKYNDSVKIRKKLQSTWSDWETV